MGEPRQHEKDCATITTLRARVEELRNTNREHEKYRRRLVRKLRDMRADRDRLQSLLGEIVARVEMQYANDKASAGSVEAQMPATSPFADWIKAFVLSRGYFPTQ